MVCVKAYRVARNDMHRAGPYNGGLPFEWYERPREEAMEAQRVLWCLDGHNSTNGHPGMQEEYARFLNSGKCDEPYDWYCAFNSLDQLMAWFTVSELKKLYSIGYVVYEYAVPFKDYKEYKSTHQVLLRLRYITRAGDLTEHEPTGTLDLSEVIKIYVKGK